MCVFRCTDDVAVKNRLSECLETILNKAQEPPKSKKVQHSNAKNAVLFEAINLIIHTDSDPNLLVRACNQLGQFLQHRETNLRSVATFFSLVLTYRPVVSLADVIFWYSYVMSVLLCRYLALESMCLLATSEFSHEAVKKHQETVVTSLKVHILVLNTIVKILYILPCAT